MIKEILGQDFLEDLKSKNLLKNQKDMNKGKLKRHMSHTSKDVSLLDVWVLRRQNLILKLNVEKSPFLEEITLMLKQLAALFQLEQIRVYFQENTIMRSYLKQMD